VAIFATARKLAQYVYERYAMGRGMSISAPKLGKSNGSSAILVHLRARARQRRPASKARREPEEVQSPHAHTSDALAFSVD